jgi:hypothetical protein
MHDAFSHIHILLDESTVNIDHNRPDYAQMGIIGQLFRLFRPLQCALGEQWWILAQKKGCG